MITGLEKNRAILGLPWLIRENSIIDWKNGTLDWRIPDVLIITQISKPDYSSSQLDDYKTTYSVAQYCINSIHLNPNITIAKAKISELIEQKYGTDNKKGLIKKQLIPKQYHKYLDRFSKKQATQFPEPQIWDHKINLKPDIKSKRIPPYSLNPKEMKMAQEFINESLAKGYIVESKSSMASPLFFIGKKDGTARPCQDYQQLNDGTIKDAFPVLNIQNLLQDLKGAKFFTKLDIQWGYNNVQIKPDHRWKAAFSTPFGLYEPTVMFFRLCNSPATFQRIMNNALWFEMTEGWCKAYMDNILIFANTKEELQK